MVSITGTEKFLCCGEISQSKSYLLYDSNRAKKGLAATRTRGLSHVYLGTLSENHTTRPQDRIVVAVVAIDETT